MITRAALCPAAPLLARPLTGRESVLPELHDACAAAVTWLIEEPPSAVVVVGPGEASVRHGPSSRLDLAAFAPGLARGDRVPYAIGLGAMLLDEVGWSGTRVLQSVAASDPPEACVALGRKLSADDGDTALLVMGDGSACRSHAAPGHFDERAEGFDANVERAVCAGNLAALAELDPSLADDLMVTGRPAWQVLAALGSGVLTDVQYCDAPLGVCYLVATIRPVY